MACTRIRTAAVDIATRARAVLNRFARNCKAATAVEFAMVSVPFLGLLVASLESAFVFFANDGLEAAVASASRQILTGQVQAANISTADQFRTTLMCPATGPRVLPSFIDCSKLIIDVRLASNFSSADMSDTFYLNSTQEFCPGKPGDIVIVRVIYPMPAFFSIMASNAYAGLVNNVPNNPGWKHILMGTSVFQEEPYGSSSSYSYLPTC